MQINSIKYKMRCSIETNLLSSSHMLVASDWWMGGGKHRTCSTGILSASLVFMYLFSTEKIWLFRIWNLRMRSTIFFIGCTHTKKWRIGDSNNFYGWLLWALMPLEALHFNPKKSFWKVWNLSLESRMLSKQFIYLFIYATANAPEFV